MFACITYTASLEVRMKMRKKPYDVEGKREHAKYYIRMKVLFLTVKIYSRMCVIPHEVAANVIARGAYTLLVIYRIGEILTILTNLNSRYGSIKNVLGLCVQYFLFTCKFQQ